MVPLEFMSDGKSIKGHKNVANGFNDFFINVGPNLARNIKGHPEKTFAEFTGSIISGSAPGSY